MQPTFLLQLKDNNKNNVVADAVNAAVAVAVTAATRNVIPNGKNALFKSAASPRR